jgi:PrtD family type I secretion system ABC transporter
MRRALSPILKDGLAGARGYLWAIVAFSFAINLLTLALPLYTVQLYDRVLLSGSGATLTVITLAALAALLCSAVLEDVRTRLFVAIGARFDGRLAAILLDRQVETSVRSGGLERAQSLRELDGLRHVLTGSGALAMLDLPWTPLFILMCFVLHPALGATALVGSLGLVGLALLNQSLVDEPMTRSTKAGEAGYAMTDMVLRNAEVVQAMGMLPDLMSRWRALRGGMITAQAQASFRNAAMGSAIKFFRLVLQITVFGLGAWLVIQRDLSAGALFAASLLTTRALAPIDQVVAVWPQLVTARLGLARVQEALLQPARPAAMALPEPIGDLSVEGLVFMTPGGREPILKGLSFALPAGESLGIVGPSAAGKSTLARLLVGALKPSAGVCRLDGADVYSWDRDGWSRAVGYVPQDIELFDGTIRDNICRFKEAEPRAIVKAAKLAGVHEMILRLPDGYETVIGAYGATLSGGQRQRLAIARAVFGDPKFIVFDEPNSNLDGEGEEVLRHLFAALRAQGTTVVVIAHRPSVLAHLDNVLVMAHGRLVEFGPVPAIMPKIAPGFPVPMPPPRVVGGSA